jgi:hypothetical protein
MMELYFGATANLANNLIQAANAAAQNARAQPPKPTQGARIDFSGEHTVKNHKRSGSLDSLGRGNIV